MLSRGSLSLYNSLRNSCLYPFLLTCSLLFQQSPPLLSAQSEALEYDVKAAFLLNFTRFVSWPPSTFTASDTPFLICILGDDPFGRSIDQLVDGESVQGHRINVLRLRNDDRKSCQMLYVADKRAPGPALLDAGPSALTVGEGDDFLHQGGMVAFVIDQHHVRFDINLKAAENSALKLSSKLLSVARLVEK